MVCQILIFTAASVGILDFVEHRLRFVKVENLVRQQTSLHESDPAVQLRLGPVLRMLLNPVTHPEEMSAVESFRQAGLRTLRILKYTSALGRHRSDDETGILHDFLLQKVPADCVSVQHAVPDRQSSRRELAGTTPPEIIIHSTRQRFRPVELSRRRVNHVEKQTGAEKACHEAAERAEEAPEAEVGWREGGAGEEVKCDAGSEVFCLQAACVTSFVSAAGNFASIAGSPRL